MCSNIKYMIKKVEHMMLKKFEEVNQKFVF